MLTILLLAAMLLGVSAWTLHAQWEQKAINSALVAAVKRSDPDAVRRCLARGADPRDSENLATDGSFYSWVTTLLCHRIVRGQCAEKISEEKIIDYKTYHDFELPDPAKVLAFKKDVAIYEMLGRARCNKQPLVCGP